MDNKEKEEYLRNITLSIQSQPVSDLLVLFQQEMKKLDILIDKIQAETKTIKETWEGNVSDTITSEVEKFKEVFDTIREQNEKYVEFINVVIEKYTDIDYKEKQRVNENVTAFDTDLYGKLDQNGE